MKIVVIYYLCCLKIILACKKGFQHWVGHCLTLRDDTKQPVTITEGTNILIAGDWELFRASIARIEDNSYLQNISAIPLWDGKASERILRVLGAG